MGKEATQAISTGEAMRISTGGMMPPETDAVVMVEYTEEVAGPLVEVHRGVSPWQNVIQIGDDIKKGELVFSRGRRLRAHDLGALTGVGISEIPVYKRPRVALISTGDEIVDADVEPLPGQVRNINQHSLAGLIEEVGCELKDWGVIRDERSALAQAIGSATIFARACGKPILGLPGYPVSALVIFDLFAAPLLRRLGGESVDTLRRLTRSIRATLKTNIASQIGREDYVRVTLDRESNRVIATPLPSKSGAIFTLVKADGMVRIEMNQDGIEQGEEVEVILF
jgi:molybdopterin molybdotransferase